MTAAHRPVVTDCDRLHDVADPRRDRVTRLPPSPQARAYLDHARRLDTLAAQQQAWEERQRDAIHNRMPPAALRPAPIRCPRPLWMRLVESVRGAFGGAR